jgi:hypothetical protein
VRRASQAGESVTADLRAWAGDREYFTTVLMHRAGGAPPAAPPEEARS